MIAEHFMVTKVVTAQAKELTSHVLDKMHHHKLRMLPVVDEENHVLGIISSFNIMQCIVPDYLVNGDLNQISYAPDLGILRERYKKIVDCPIQKIMDTAPLFVNKNESLLSVSAALSAYGKHEYALVVDDEKHLQGIISAGDILGRLKLKASEKNNA